MTYTKALEFEKELQEIALIAKVLSHPARLAILKYLAEMKTCISGDIANELPLSRTTVSQHLQELKKFDLIKGEIDGQKVCYCINAEKFKQCQQLVNQFFKEIESNMEFDCEC
jgi:DNA-binding transcriptional ArsR family regulator